VISSRSTGMSRRRIWAGLGCGAVSLILITVALVATRGTLSLADVVLLYLIPVVVAAVVGGLWAALPAALATDLVVNFFFIPPYYTLIVGDLEHVIVLLSYVLIALVISIAVDVAARLRAQAVKREVETRLLSRASTAPLGEGSLPDLLNDIKDTFGMTGVALLESQATGEEQVASVGVVGQARPVLSAPAGDSLRLVAWGPEVFGEDAAALRRMAGVAARALEAQRLSAEAARADDLAQIDRARSALLAAVGHDLRTPLAGIKVAVSSLRQSDATLPPAAEAELLATIDLAIARCFMEAMGGEIRPTDTPGGGLTMIISLHIADHASIADMQSTEERS
jgi:K+-sensing histidine kinase KdpD